ncbi:5'-methylthioadenosine/S-adenosylhomocysteine nucleosidase [compost metagenome]|uniref:hypothetical protein n=2 Tax=Pseudomonadota TaxID=1224 RepID=UPI001AE292D1
MTVKIDVLLIAALKMELDAAQQVFSASDTRPGGVAEWHSVDQDKPNPYIWGVYQMDDSQSFRIAFARPNRMGGDETGSVASALTEKLKPFALVMCGVCAGNPDDAALGDVLIADRTFNYHEGKTTTADFQRDLHPRDLSPIWQRAAQTLTPQGLPSYGAPSEDDAAFWLMERLYNGADPRRHPARQRYFPERSGSWESTLARLETSNFVKRTGTTLELTDVGRDTVERSMVYNVDPPEQLPFDVLAGPMASGDIVVKDGLTWDMLKAGGIRTVIGLEMEAATIGVVSRTQEVPEWVVIKGVMDHADPKKDDRFKPFAAKASAEVLERFLVGRMSARGAPAEEKHTVAAAANWRMRRNSSGLVKEIGAIIEREAPHFSRSFELAYNAAMEGYQDCESAERLAKEVEQRLGEKLVDERLKPKKRTVGQTKHRTEIKLQFSYSGRSVMARLWSTGDEYLGEARQGIETGLGIYKIYPEDRDLTPASLALWCGRSDDRSFGPRGVYSFPDTADIAGHWVEARPSLGYREFLNRSSAPVAEPDLDCDFYLGEMDSVVFQKSRKWVPHGRGIAVDVRSRTIRCGSFHEGKFASRAEITRLKF